jgi:mannose-6-phosphate isomerase-like protein (cupin superfamily)
MSGLRLVRPDDRPGEVPPGHREVLARDLVPATTGARLQFCEMEAGGGAAAHVHDEENQVFFVIAGGLEVNDPQRGPVEVNAGQAVFIPAGVAHATENKGKTTATYLVITYAKASPK